MKLLAYMDAVQSLETASLVCEASKNICTDQIKKLKKEISALERKREKETEKQKEILKKERNLQREAESKFHYPVNHNEQGGGRLPFLADLSMVAIFAFIPVLIATIVVLCVMHEFVVSALAVGQIFGWSIGLTLLLSIIVAAVRSHKAYVREKARVEEARAKIDEHRASWILSEKRKIENEHAQSEKRDKKYLTEQKKILKSIDLLEDIISRTSTMESENDAYKAKLYDMDVVPSKYRSLIPLSMFLDYLKENDGDDMQTLIAVYEEQSARGIICTDSKEAIERISYLSASMKSFYDSILTISRVLGKDGWSEPTLEDVQKRIPFVDEAIATASKKAEYVIAHF